MFVTVSTTFTCFDSENIARNTPTYASRPNEPRTGFLQTSLSVVRHLHSSRVTFFKLYLCETNITWRNFKEIPNRMDGLIRVGTKFETLFAHPTSFIFTSSALPFIVPTIFDPQYIYLACFCAAFIIFSQKDLELVQNATFGSNIRSPS